ncbi:MAG: polysaccharide deacetylase family protein [Armatimonadetes bacterium]|nr:polysaccharide deacetylase family protein [Armatimonadota bacterium]
MASGIFIISLDFELAWGLKAFRDRRQWLSLTLQAREVVPRLLDLLVRHEVHATWAVVGLIMCSDVEEALSYRPEVRPDWRDRSLDAYAGLDELRHDAEAARAHFAPELAQEIATRPGQEIATHTFSHYSCLEAGHTPEAFRADLQAAARIAGRHGLEPRTIVFPRNQVGPDCLRICAEEGIRAYRGVLPGLLHRPRRAGEGRFSPARMLRSADVYVNLRGYDCFPLPAPASELPINLPGSRLLRTAPSRWGLLQRAKQGRITAGMTYAARRGLVYHLWWHPHNFAENTERKLAALAELLEHFRRLRETMGMRSLNMIEAAELAGKRDADGGGEVP